MSDNDWPAGKTFGELTPAQRNAASKRAAGQLEGDLAADADAIVQVLDGAGLAVTEFEGRTGDATHITRIERGTIPLAVIAHLPGVKGEVPGQHRNRQGAAWDAFKADVARTGIQVPIFITVDHDSWPKISEGNHRRDAAAELGMTMVPVLIRYFGHAEAQGTVIQRAHRR